MCAFHVEQRAAHLLPAPLFGHTRGDQLVSKPNAQQSRICRGREKRTTTTTSGCRKDFAARIAQENALKLQTNLLLRPISDLWAREGRMKSQALGTAHARRCGPAGAMGPRASAARHFGQLLCRFLKMKSHVTANRGWQMLAATSCRACNQVEAQGWIANLAKQHFPDAAVLHLGQHDYICASRANSRRDCSQMQQSIRLALPCAVARAFD